MRPKRTCTPVEGPLGADLWGFRLNICSLIFLGILRWENLRSSAMTRTHVSSWSGADCWAWKGWEVVWLWFWLLLSCQPCKTGLWWNDWLLSLFYCLSSLSLTFLPSSSCAPPHHYHSGVVEVGWLCLPGTITPFSIIAPSLQGNFLFLTHPGHCHWPSNEHMTQAGPIRVLPWDFTT